MKRETAKRLLDVQRARLEMEQFADGESSTTILTNRGLQLILHKLLEIVGEALNQVAKSDPGTASKIPNLHRFVNLRNQVTHGYASVDYSIVWDVFERQIPELNIVVTNLLTEAPPLK